MANTSFPSVSFTFTKPVRLLYTETLLQPKKFKNDDGTEGLPRYNLQGIIPPDHPQLGEFYGLVLQVAQQALPAHVDQTGQWSPQGLKLPIKSGDQMIAEHQAKARARGKQPADKAFYAGQWVVFAQKPEKSQAGNLLQPPVLVVLQNGQKVRYEDEQRSLAKPFFYNGVLASVSVQLKGFTGFGGGVTCYIDRVLSLNTGERINIGRSDDDVFADDYSQYVGHVSAESVVPLQHPYAPGGIGVPTAPQYAPRPGFVPPPAPQYAPQPGHTPPAPVYQGPQNW